MTENVQKIEFTCAKVPNLIVLSKHYFAYWSRSNFDFWKLSILLISCFLKELTFLIQNPYLFQIVEPSLKVRRVKEKFSDNLGLYILARFQNLVQVRIATSKTLPWYLVLQTWYTSYLTSFWTVSDLGY